MAEETGRNSDSSPLCRELLKISLDSMTILQSSGVLRNRGGKKERSEEKTPKIPRTKWSSCQVQSPKDGDTVRCSEEMRPATEKQGDN